MWETLTLFKIALSSVFSSFLLHLLLFTHFFLLSLHPGIFILNGLCVWVCLCRCWRLILLKYFRDGGTNWTIGMHPKFCPLNIQKSFPLNRTRMFCIWMSSLWIMFGADWCQPFEESKMCLKEFFSMKCKIVPFPFEFCLIFGILNMCSCVWCLYTAGL